MNKLILLSGASGFVGKNLLQYSQVQAPHFQFIKLVRDNYKIAQDEMAWSALTETELPNLDAIIHLAGKAHDIKNVADPISYFEINTKLSLKLFEAFLRSSATQFIFMSSVKAVADAAERTLTEEAYPNPISVYGQSKRLAEQQMQKALQIWKEAHPNAIKKLIILRPCMIHGPGNKGNLNALYQLVYKGIPWPLAAFENKRSFVSIENLCFTLHQFINHDLKEGIYQVADDDAISTNELIQLIGQANQKRIRLLRIPKSVIIALAKLGDTLNLPLNSERLQKLTENYVVSNTKLVKTIGVPLPVNSKEGLLQTLKSFNK